MIRILQFIALFSIFLLAFCKTDSPRKRKSSTRQQTIQSGQEISGEDTVVAVSPEQPDTSITSARKEDFQESMVYFEGGEFLMGNENGPANERPAHRVHVDPFYIDPHEVTVSQFRDFISATAYVTDAGKFGDAGVYDIESGQWNLVKGANWEYPLGKAASPAPDDHPVTQVSWNDATAYAAWAGKRLPDEAEWEYAARGGRDNGPRYPWGNQPVVNGRYRANVWQGPSQFKNEEKDGYKYASPAGAFGTGENGLTDMSGNVWEWCNDTYRLYPGNPSPIHPDPNTKVIRGGSFMYDQAGNASFTVTFRGSTTRETSLFNIGFRCAMDP